MLRVTVLRWVLVAGLLAGSSGCRPSGDSAEDEEKDPHFVVGMTRKQALDYEGAVAAFGEALEANPRSAAAHFELGLICYQNVNDWAGAIYHFEQFCRLRPDSNKVDAAKQFIAACKQELVREVPLGSISQQLQKEFARLTQENKELRQQIDQLRQQLAQRPALVVTNPPGPAPEPAPLARATADPAAGQPGAPDDRPKATPATRTHAVKAGETTYSIARRYGIQTSALLAANPGIEPRRLRIGQVLNIPRP